MPPLFPGSRSKADRIAHEAAIEQFKEVVRSIRVVADVFLLANVKDQRRLKFDSVHAAVMLQEDFKLETAPVVVVRDQNRPQFLSTILTVVSLGLNSAMIAWGDDYPSGATNVRDFPNLAEAIRAASLIRSRARSPTRFFAPVDIDSLAYRKGVALANERLRAGADLLLAQPPTTDGETLERHTSLVERTGLKERVLLNVFPFKDEDDMRRYERMFGWKLPRSIHAEATRGEDRLLELERGVVKRMRSEGFPGIYVSTRGTPAVAERLLS